MSHEMAVKIKNWSLYAVSWNTNMSLLNWFQMNFLLPPENAPIIYNSVWKYVGRKTVGEIFKNSKFRVSTNQNNCFQKDNLNNT